MTIKIKCEFINKSFCRALTRYTKMYAYSILRNDMLQKVQKDFDKKDIIPNFNVREFIRFALEHFDYKMFKDEVLIFISPKILYKDTGMKLEDLCDLFNYGAMDIEGYPLFSNALTHIKKNVKMYRDMFVNGW